MAGHAPDDDTDSATGSIDTWSTPSRYLAPDDAHATDDLLDLVERRPDHVLFERSGDTGRRTVTAREFADQVIALAAGLIAVGVRPGDRIALLSGTRYEWVLCDFAIWMSAAVTVPIYPTSSADQIAWVLADTEAHAVFVEDVRLKSMVDGVAAPAVRHVWRMTGGGLTGLAAAGMIVSRAEVLRRRRRGGAGAPATIVYTSGTTGRPKGCVLSHRNLVSEVRNVLLADGIGDRVLTDRDTILLFLPLAHIFTRVVQLAAVRTGARTGHTSDLADLPGALRAFRPTVLVAVPRVFEKLHDAAAARAATTWLGARIFHAAEATALAYSRALDTGGPGPRLRATRWVFDRLVYAKLRATLGGRARYAVSGGAPLRARLGHFLRGAGISVLEGWGLTETSSGATFNLPAAQRIGSVGRPLPGCAVRIAADGEVLVRGAAVFCGYWRNPVASNEVLDPDGWLHTGDLGELRDGYLTIVGRRKDLIVTASGKNVAPAWLEEQLRAHRLIDQCVLVGDDRPYIAALITLDPAAFNAWKREHGKPADATVAGLRGDAALVSSIQSAIDEVNRTVSRAETIKRFRILATRFEVGAELTPAQTVRRAHVLRKFGTEVDALYAGA